MAYPDIVTGLSVSRATGSGKMQPLVMRGNATADRAGSRARVQNRSMARCRPKSC